MLVARFSALGDVAMTLPAVYDACRSNPGLSFYYLTRKHPASMFVNAPENLTMVSVDLDNYKGPAGLWRLALSLKRRYRIDTFVDLHNVLRTRVLSSMLALFGVRSRHVFKNRAGRRAVTRRSNKRRIPLTPMPQRYVRTFEAAGIPVERSFISIFPPEGGPTQSFADVTHPKRPGERWITVAPFARHTGKIYPLNLMTEVVRHFAARPDTKVFVYGFGDEESREIETMRAGDPHVVNMAEHHLGLPGELSLLSHSDIMLSMDSANMHLASLAGLRTVSIWGATHPLTGFSGYGQRQEDEIGVELDCRPCSVFGNKPCRYGDYRCLSRISPETVVSHMEDILKTDRQ